MSNKVLIVLEQREKIIKKASFEAASVGIEIAKTYNIEAEAVIAGSEITNISDTGKYGVSKVTHLKSDQFEYYSSSGYSKAISEFAKEVNAEFVIVPNTAMGKDLAPRIAVQLQAGCIMDAVNYEFESGGLIVTRPVYAGKALVKVKFNSEVKVLTCRPNVFKASEDAPVETDIT